MELDSGNTAWMLAASALVLFMTPGLGFFYGGLTRNKNVLATIMQSFICTGIVAIIWVTFGYSLAFGPDQGLGLIGNFDHIGLKDVGMEPLATGIPHLMFMSFQLMFAIITPALITGAFAERAKFGPFLLFIALWCIFVYLPVAHWVFGTDGWLSAFASNPETPDIGLNSLDFAGGLAIHVNAAAAAIAAVLVFGKRKGYGKEPMEPHDITMVVLGAAILFFGWFGFNAGSALAANGQAAYAFVNTAIAGSVAGLSWALVSWQFSGKPSVVGAASGAVAGLVAVTPAAGYVMPMEAMVIGLVAGGICYGAVRVRAKIGFDDSLDVVGVHGVGGMWGAIATGLFANAAVSGFGALAPGFGDGALQGEWMHLWAAIVGIVAVGGYSFLVTFIILKALDLTVGIRVSESDEEMGLDMSQHGERAYSSDDTGVPLGSGAVMPAPPVAYTAATSKPQKSGI